MATFSFFFQLTCGDLQGISQPTVCNIIGQMADQISDHCGRFIAFPPNNDELRQKHVKFFNIGRFPGVSGVIDCTRFEISSPSYDRNMSNSSTLVDSLVFLE
uniref:Nuclease HARBI1 n=1 Tax=Cacopsylla melanoneura TaxID=428564 RepID=A0A8D8QWL1_9HEMI